MLTSVNKFVVHKTCGELTFSQQLHDSRGNRGMVDWSIIGWVESCSFLMCGNWGRRFSIGGKVLLWTVRVNTFVNSIEITPT